MTLTKKEQNLVLLIGALAVAYGLYWGFGQWTALQASMDDELAKAQEKATKNSQIIEAGKKARASFDASRIQTLAPDRPDYAPTQRLIEQTFNGGGLVFTNWGASGTPRPVQNNREFQEAKYTAQATTTTARLARFLQYIEAAKIPARIDGIDISSTKPGVDNLRVQFTISALLYAPAKAAPTGRGATPGAATASRPVNASNRGGTQPAATGPETSTDVSRIEKELEQRRASEEAHLANSPDTQAATTPAAAAPKKTPEEIEAELAAKRQAEEASLNNPGGKVAATATAPATAPATTPGGTP